MTAGPPYSEYRPSALQWIPEIPAHWQVMPTWALARRVRRLPSAGDGVVTAFRDGQVTLRSNRRTDGFTEALQEHGYQGVRRGELVIHSMDGFAGAIGVADSNGKMSPVAHIYSIRAGEPRYFALLLREMALSGFVESLAKGIRERSSAFDKATFKSLSVPVPPADEQRSILAFVDHETAQIDSFVAKNEHLISLLAERKSAVTTRAVLGLESSLTISATGAGLDWHKVIPPHWHTVPAWAVARPVRRPPEASAGVVTAFRNGQVTLRSNRRTEGFTEAIHEHGYQGVREGELVIHSMDGAFGAVGVADSDGKMSPVVHIYRVDHQEPAYIAHTLRVMGSIGYLASLGKGIRERSTAFDRQTFRALRLPMPPLEEQRAILDRISLEVSRIDEGVRAARQAIALARERRAALISAAVTGKINVGGFL